MASSPASYLSRYSRLTGRYKVLTCFDPSPPARPSLITHSERGSNPIPEYPDGPHTLHWACPIGAICPQTKQQALCWRHGSGLPPCTHHVIARGCWPAVAYCVDFPWLFGAAPRSCCTGRDVTAGFHVAVGCGLATRLTGSRATCSSRATLASAQLQPQPDHAFQRLSVCLAPPDIREKLSAKETSGEGGREVGPRPVGSSPVSFSGARTYCGNSRQEWPKTDVVLKVRYCISAREVGTRGGPEECQGKGRET